MPPNSHRRCRLLLIEDDCADVVLVERAMEQFPDFELRAVDRLQAALAALAAEQFDVALLDLSLPDSFGLEGVEALHARHADLPVVVLTGLSDGNLALEALERGAQDYLSKSQGSPEVLVRTLRYAIQRQQIHGENRRLMAELALQACHDPLTGILNRRSLVAELDRQWQLATRSGQPLSCSILDIDYFKRVNDVHGHAAGDTVLQAVAALLRENCRLGDLCGRYGGEEFLVILPQTTEDGAATWAQRLRQRIAATPIGSNGLSLHVTASFGVAERSSDVTGCQQLVDRADQALRMAKQSGRDQVVSFQQACNDASLAGRCDALARLTAADIMLPLVTMLDDQATLRQATALLLNLRLDSAPVVDRQGNLVGVVGEEDLAAALSGSDAWERSVTEVMRSGSACFDAHSPAVAVHDFLARVAARRVIILDGCRPVGVVSRASILRWRENRDLSLLASLQPVKTTPQAARDRLTQLACEVQRQSSAMLHSLTNGDGSPAERVVVAATRIQMLLEDAVAHAQRLEGRSPEQGTLGGLTS